MELCERCIQAIKSHGEHIFVNDIAHSIDDEQQCEWCGEVDDLYECSFEKEE